MTSTFQVDLRGMVDAEHWFAHEAVTALATGATEASPALDALADAAHAFGLAGRLQRARGDVEDAVRSLESTVEGFELAHRRGEVAARLAS